MKIGQVTSQEGLAAPEHTMELQSALVKVSESLRRLSEAVLPSFIEDVATVTESINDLASTISADSLNGISGSLGDATRAVAEYAREIDLTALLASRKVFDDYPRRLREFLRMLSMHGWFLDLDMSIPELAELTAELDKGNVSDVNESLIERFQARSPVILRSLIERFPHRRHLFVSAFDAHGRGDYISSVPVFLAQTDGICKEQFKFHFFLKLKRDSTKPEAAQYVERLVVDSLTAALLSPLTMLSPIMFSSADRGPDFQELNRHSVLHGEAIDYGTLLNSCKAMSLLNYIGHVFDEK